jgi:hypothetical protein
MKKIILTTFLSFFISSVSFSQSKLPECKPTDKVLYHNCYGKKFYGRDGKYYEAEFKNNLPAGEVKFSNGDKYIGGWNDQWFNGKGTYTSSNGTRYVGEYKNGNKNGKGIYTLPSGTKIEGEFENDKLIRGEMNYSSGANYIGEFKNYLPEGIGTLTWKGKKEIGTFKEGKLHGKGKVFLTNGQLYYDGELKDGLPHGQGIIYLKEGGTYVGEFKNDYIDGIGTLTKADGTKFTGEFKEGKVIKVLKNY